MKRTPDDDDDMGDMWREIKARGQEKRARNRMSSEQLLRETGITFESKNDGAHLIIRVSQGGIVDFWPGTGRWTVRGFNTTSFGVHRLIRWCGTEQPEQERTAEVVRLRGLLCKCDMRTKLVGDGCEYCNPELAEELKEQE